MSRQADEEEVARVALVIARTADAMRAHALLRVAQLLERQRDDWGETVWPMLHSLGEALGGSWDWSRGETADYRHLAEHLLDLAADQTGRTRAALHQAADAIAELELQRREALR